MKVTDEAQFPVDPWLTAPLMCVSLFSFVQVKGGLVLKMISPGSKQNLRVCGADSGPGAAVLSVPYLPDILNSRKITFVENQERGKHHELRARSMRLVSWAESVFKAVHVDFFPLEEKFRC